MLAETKARLEDIYLPFKPKRRTKAQIAREAGPRAGRRRPHRRPRHRSRAVTPPHSSTVPARFSWSASPRMPTWSVNCAN